MTAERPCYIIAEAGVNHNGSEELAFQLVDAALAAGADAVKFQTFKAEKLVTRQAKKAAYQEIQTGAGDQFAMLKALELSEAAHQRLADHCNEQGIEFLSTAFDEESADFLITLGCRRIKIPSGELTNAPFLRFLAAKGLPIILSTGMADMEEVAQAISVIVQERERRGFAEHPAQVESETIATLARSSLGRSGRQRCRMGSTVALGLARTVPMFWSLTLSACRINRASSGRALMRLMNSLRSFGTTRVGVMAVAEPVRACSVMISDSPKKSPGYRRSRTYLSIPEPKLISTEPLRITYIASPGSP